MSTSRILRNRVLRGKWLIPTLGLGLVVSSSLPAAVLFSDNFDSYADGTNDLAYKAAYNNNPGAGDVVSSGTGLGGSKSIQNTLDTTLIRKDLPMNLSANDSVTLNVFFQQQAAPSGAARPQIGLLGLNDNGGIFNGGTGGDVSARIGGANNLELRANNGAVATGAVQSLTDGNWYNLRFTATKSSTANNFDLACWIYNSDSAGNTGTLVDSLSFAGFSNPTIYNDTSVYAGLRESSTILNMDNFSATVQVSASPTTTLTDSLTAVDTIYGMASLAPTSFHVSGTFLTGNLTVTPPLGYEVSTSSGSGYTTSLTLTPASGTLASTQVYVRLAATTAVGTYSGNITVSGGGATSKTMATAASTVTAAPTVTSFTLMYPGTGGPVAGYDPLTNNATINLSFLGTNLSIRANTSPGNDFGSVSFNLAGATTQSQTDNSYPWSLSGDSGGSYTGRVFNVGAHTLTATPYSADGGTGSAGIAATINFTVTNPVSVYPPVGYSLVWSDEFNGTALDTTKWGYENAGAWRDGYNTPNAVSVTNGLLTITTYTQNGVHYTCELNTFNKFTPKFGYMEASIDFGDSAGMWSDFWLYDYNVPVVGNPKTNGVEVDIIEHLAQSNGQDVSNQGGSTLHWDGYSTSHKSVNSGSYNFGFATGFHTIACLWTSDAYKFIMDGVVVWTATNAPGQDPVPPLNPVSQTNQFLLISSEIWNNAWCGLIPSGGFGSLATSTTKLKVDYVRYYQLVPDTTPPVVSNVTPTNGASLFANLPLQVSATVTDNVAVAFAQLFFDGALVPPAVSNAPYSFMLTNVSLGAHTLAVAGQDTSGNRATNKVNVTVVTPPDTTPPVVSNVTPVNGANLFANLPLQVSATLTDNVAVASVQLYLDGTVMPPILSNAPYSFTLTNVSLGSHTLAVTGQDTSGNRATNGVTVMLVAPVPPPLSLSATGGRLQLSWGAPGFTLQQAALCTGPWTNLVPPPASPLAITPTNPRAFFRLLWSSP